MRRILIVEDEEMLREGMMRALAKLPEVEVMGAGSVGEALARIDDAAPDAVISDLNLPDRFGGELLEELDRRGLRIPVTFVSAYTRSLGEKVPRSPRVRLIEKPISLARLRDLAMQALTMRCDSELPPPFGLSDYLELAFLGRHSVVITQQRTELDEDAVGRIVVWKGQLWAAYDAQGDGEAAFRRIVVSSGGVFHCHTLDGDPGPRQLDGNGTMLLLDALRCADEEKALRAGEPTYSDDASSGEVPRARHPAAFGSEANTQHVPDRGAKSPLPGASADTADVHAGGHANARGYDEAFERGVTALISRDYRAAAEWFAEALRQRPGDRVAAANIERLRALGYVHDEDGSGGSA